MFDANLRHLPQGLLFFTEVHYCDNPSLVEFGLEEDDLVLCSMLSKGNENPQICLMKNGKAKIVTEDDFKLGDSWFVYSGRYDLTDFICDRQKARAEQIINLLK